MAEHRADHPATASSPAPWPRHAGERDKPDAIGYLIPQFPGQTHAFFWRERAALRDLGIDAQPVSTRRPPRKIVSHAWSGEAARLTTYLMPPSPTLTAAGLAAAAGRLASLRRMLAQCRLSRIDAAAVTAMAAQVVALSRRRRWRHIHVHSCGNSALVAAAARVMGGVPYSLTLHGPLADYGPDQPVKWRHADFGIVITRKLERELRAALPESLPAQIVVAPMGVTLSAFERPTAYVPWTGGPLRLFSCGRLNRVKGHDHLIHAVSLLRNQGMDVHLSIAGEDEQGGTGYRKSLEALIARLGVGSSVALLGAVDEGVVKRHLGSAHIFALASLHEPLGVAIMEAMAMRTPVVATDAGGVGELIRSGHDGLLVPPGDAGALADAIRRLSDDPSLAQRLSDAGRATVEASFSDRVSAQAIARLIRQGSDKSMPVGASAAGGAGDARTGCRGLADC